MKGDLGWELGNEHPDQYGSHKPQVATEHAKMWLVYTEIYHKCQIYTSC